MPSPYLRTSRIPDAAVIAGESRAASHAASLSITALERLAPHGHLKAGYPHIWERIWLFCDEPAHLEKYLLSLSIQDRGGARQGLRPEAMIEVADILAANQRFLSPEPSGRVWDAAALKR